MNTIDNPLNFDAGLILPAHMAHYRPMIQEAMGFFVSRLPAARQAEIAATQAALPTDADDVARLIALMHCCPSLHKLGQVVARHRGLDPDVRTRLQRLEMFKPSGPIDEIRRIIHEDLNRLGVAEDVQIAESAIAEASVAIVVPIAWHRTPSGPRQQGVLKVRKPGIEEKLAEELAILAELADHFDSRHGEMDFPAIDYRETFETVRELLAQEVRLDVEQKNIAEAVGRFAHRRDVWIPRLLPFCTPRITAMERISGQKVTQIGELPHWRLRGMARTIVDALIADTVFSKDGPAIFHADPHAGNLFATEEGKLAILDWSLTGRLSKADRVAVSQVLLAAIQLDARRMAQAIGGIAALPVDEVALMQAAETSLRELRQGRLMGPAWLIRLMDAAALAGVRFSGDLLLFRKTLLTIDGVIADVCESASLDAILIASGVQAFLKDWPNRLWTPIDSRDFSTHVSNGDLLSLCVTAPFVAGSYWLRSWRDWALAASPLR